MNAQIPKLRLWAKIGLVFFAVCGPLALVGVVLRLSFDTHMAGWEPVLWEPVLTWLDWLATLLLLAGIAPSVVKWVRGGFGPLPPWGTRERVLIFAGVYLQLYFWIFHHWPLYHRHMPPTFLHP